MNENQFDFFSKKTVVVESDNDSSFGKIVVLLVTGVIISIGMFYGISYIKNKENKEKLITPTVSSSGMPVVNINNLPKLSKEKVSPQPSVAQTAKELWADNYNTLSQDLIKYNIKSLSFVKYSSYYTVDAEFLDGKTIQSQYPFSQDLAKKGFDTSYELSLEMKKQPNSESIMVTEGMSQLVKNANVDKTLVDNHLVPEIRYLIKRAGYSYIWKKVPEYSVASFSPNKLDEMSQSFPTWAKTVGPDFLGYLLLNINNENSVYYSDPRSPVTAANMLRHEGVTAKKKDVCNSIKQNSELSERDVLFIEAASGSSLENLKSTCK